MRSCLQQAFVCCRLEVLVQCDAGVYQLQSGQGQFATQDPGCGSSHCDVIQQPIIATINVVSPVHKWTGLMSIHVPVCSQCIAHLSYQLQRHAVIGCTSTICNLVQFSAPVNLLKLQ